MPHHSEISRRAFVGICASIVAAVVIAGTIDGETNASDEVEPPHVATATTPPVAMPFEVEAATILSGDEYVSYVLLDFEPPRPGMGNVPHAVALEVFFDYDECIRAVMASDDAFICVPYEM